MFALFHVGRARHRTSQPQEIAPGVYCMEVGAGIMRSNVYFVRSGSSWALIDRREARGTAPTHSSIVGGIHHGLVCFSFSPPGIAIRLDIDTIGEPRIPRRLDPATAGDHPLANYHPGLCPRLLYLWKRDRLGLALGRPGIAARPGSA